MYECSCTAQTVAKAAKESRGPLVRPTLLTSKAALFQLNSACSHHGGTQRLDTHTSKHTFSGSVVLSLLYRIVSNLCLGVYG